MVRDLKLKIQEVEQTSNKINLKPRHIIIKFLKTKNKEMMTTRRLSNKADFRAKKISGNRQGHYISITE